MELFKKIIKILDSNLIHCLIPIIITLIIIEFFFKNRFETQKTINLIRWSIIIYIIITCLYFLLSFVFNKNEFTNIYLGNGSYKIIYWIMLIFSLILPFTLLINKVATKYWYVLLVAFAMKNGFYFEQIIIFTTSLHREYVSENESLKFVGLHIFQGIIIAILTLIVFEIVKKIETNK